jgi:hypothetical protein
MFATDAGDWAPDPVFHVKLLMITVSIIFSILVQVWVPKWSATPEVPTWAKIFALIALLLWVGTILSASEFTLLPLPNTPTCFS